MNLNSVAGDHDPAHPQVTRCPSKICKLGFDNPDYTYISTSEISSEYNYRLYGSRGTAPLILFQLLETFSSGAIGGSSRISSGDMKFRADGSWEVFLGKTKPEQVPSSNWLQFNQRQGQLIVRILHKDWADSIEPSIQIEVLDSVDHSPASFTPERMAMAGLKFSKMIPGQLDRWIRIIENSPLNEVVVPCRGWTNGCTGVGGFGNYSSGGQYKIAIDQALIIESEQIQARYENIQLANIWGESLDYANRQTSLNGTQAVVDSDGIYRYVLSHEDPGVTNWLDISGHPEGALFMRWVLEDEAKEPRKPTVKLVSFDKLSLHLPADTSKVSRSQRREELKSRLYAYNRRTNPANLH